MDKTETPTDKARPIAVALVEAALERDFRISVFASEEWAIENERDREVIVGNLFQTDEATLRFVDAEDHVVGSAFLFYDNGEDALVDFTDNEEMGSLNRILARRASKL